MPPSKPPTMQDVARLAGVSTMTVSRALRDGTSVNKETREAIHRVAEQLGYVFDSRAANLRRQRTDFVAVTVPSINNANFADTVRGLEQVLAGHGLQVLLGYTDYDVEQEERLVEQLLQRRPEAIVLTGGQHTPRCRRLLESSQIPVIETWDMPAEPIQHVVGFSNSAATGMLVDHLVSQGLERIAFLGGDTARDSRGGDRRAGFVSAMQAHGLDAGRLFGAGTPPVAMKEGAEAMARLLADIPDIEAVVCVSDLVAYGALTECQRRAIEVPGKIMLAGFGDYEIAGICVPSLTTVDPFPSRIGEEAAGIVLAALRNELGEPVRTAIGPELRVRGTTAR